MKIVYTCFCTDVIHEGHMNIIKEAKKLGRVIIGVATDKVMVRYNRFPTIPFEERVQMIRSIDGISEVVKQDDVMYENNIRLYRPDIVVHGDYNVPKSVDTLRRRDFQKVNCR